MECPRCESDVDGTASFCSECGLNFDEIREKLELTEDAGAPESMASGSGAAETAASGAGVQQSGATGGTQGGQADAGGRAPRNQQASADQQHRAQTQEPQAQQSDGGLSRRQLLVGGVAVASVGLWQTGNLEWLLGGESGDWPTPSGVERVSLTEEQKNRVRSQVGSQDVQVRVYSTTEGDPLSYYQADSVDGWKQQSSFESGGTFRKDDQGLLVLVQQRGEFLDLGLPQRTPTPTDVVLVKGDWQTVNQ
jgi:hypothetical protein